MVCRRSASSRRFRRLFEFTLQQLPQHIRYRCPAFERNDSARYLDGYVSLGGKVSTKAIRLRVVSQWADNGDRGTSSLRIDQGGRSLDPRRCRIAGVAALQYLGDEEQLDTLAYQRLEVRDGQTGKLVRELQVKSEDPEIVGIPTSLSFDDGGGLFGPARR